MADTKLSALTSVTAASIVGADLVYIVQASGPTSKSITVTELLKLFQAANADLTALSGIGTTTYGRSLLTGADAAATRTTLGLGTLATQSGTFSGTSSGTNTGDQTTVSGNAGTATALQTARNINGVSFNGSANITVTADASTLTNTTLASNVLASSLTSTGTLTGGATGAGFTVALGTSTITGILGSVNGGTANGFTKFSGPASTEKTFTLPNGSDSIGCLGTANSWTALQTFSNNINTPLITNATQLDLDNNGTVKLRIGSTGAQMANGNFLAWASGAVGTTSDVGISRVAAGVLKITGGTSGQGDLCAPARSPAQITADQNNYSPGVGIFQRWNTDASRNITGMAAGQDGVFRFIRNSGSFNIVFNNQNASSTAANRFTSTTGADLTLASNKVLFALYDSTSTTWVISLLP